MTIQPEPPRPTVVEAPVTGVEVPAAGVEVPAAGDGVRLTADVLGIPLGRRATLVQFSSTFCAPCRATRRVLEHVVATDDGVAHVELDVADRSALGRLLSVDVTPTVLVLDADGVVRRRASGAPSLAQARAVVGQVAGRSV